MNLLRMGEGVERGELISLVREPTQAVERRSNESEGDQTSRVCVELTLGGKTKLTLLNARRLCV